MCEGRRWWVRVGGVTCGEFEECEGDCTMGRTGAENV